MFALLVAKKCQIYTAVEKIIIITTRVTRNDRRKNLKYFFTAIICSSLNLHRPGVTTYQYLFSDKNKFKSDENWELENIRTDLSQHNKIPKNYVFLRSNSSTSTSHWFTCSYVTKQFKNSGAVFYTLVRCVYVVTVRRHLRRKWQKRLYHSSMTLARISICTLLSGVVWWFCSV